MKLVFTPFVKHNPIVDEFVFGDDYIETIKGGNGSVAVVREGKKSVGYASYEKLSDIGNVPAEALKRYKD